MNKKIRSGCLGFSFLCFLFFIASMFLNRQYFEALACESVIWYECRQFLAILVLFIVGLIFMTLIRQTLSFSWCCLFAFPTGICLWCFCGFLLLILHIPFTFGLTVSLIGFLLFLSFVIRRYTAKSSFSVSLTTIAQHTPFLYFILGTALLSASGFTYVFLSYDSFFYFTNYGHTLSIVKNFQDIVGSNSFTLTNISQFLPILNAYTSFWGLDQCYQIQAMLAFNILLCFYYGLYEYSRHALRFSFLFTLLLATSTSFITVSCWILANMYCMAYIFLLFLASFLVSHLHQAKTEAIILISLYFVALTLLRKDGIVFSAFFLICFTTAHLFSKKQLAFLFLPAALTECVWLFYVRIMLDAKVSQAVYSSLANNKNIFFIFCIIAGTYLYLFLAHDLLLWIQKKIPFLTEYVILFAGMIVLFVACFILKDFDIIIDNVDFTMRNMFYYPSSWGISAFFFCVLLVFSLIKKYRIDYLHFLWSGYAFLNLISYCLVDNKWFWLNWDDSYNRVLLQIVPVFVFIMSIKILPVLSSSAE